MNQLISPPDHRSLLPPLLACLPLAVDSPRPPPALLPLLSPVLRQRVQLLAVTSPSPADSWLPLLCWDPDHAEKLARIVEGEAFQLHPVSGEIDVGDVEPITFQRFDEETLQANFRIPDLALCVTYLWCQGDQEGGRDGWRVAEVTPLGGSKQHSIDGWSASITEADEKAENSRREAPLGPVDDDDGGYWAQYDKTPGRSPGPSSGLTVNGAVKAGSNARTALENDYFARYGQVQPDLDNDDSFMDRNGFGESTLNGHEMMASRQRISQLASVSQSHAAVQISHDMYEGSDISQPKASSPSDGSAMIPRLEESAATQSVSEVVIRQHISTTIKSLFRLSRGAGMDRQEFDELVRTELDTLSLMEEDD